MEVMSDMVQAQGVRPVVYTPEQIAVLCQWLNPQGAPDVQRVKVKAARGTIPGKVKLGGEIRFLRSSIDTAILNGGF